MGVRHLKSTLEPFASRQSLKNFAIVIDGHALAYHIYYTCLSAKFAAQDVCEAQPDYNELATFIQAWLESLCQSQVVIKRIFFDGYLPDSKLNTRLSRLASLTLQLQKYYKLNTTSSQSPSIHVEGRVSFSGAYTVPTKHLSCLPPPFLVPVILEVLFRSDIFKKITEVVPWEADLYCANYVKNNGGLVLTGDSDLLLHNLGPDGRVAFFNDIKKVSSNSEISALVYHPFVIQKNLDLGEHHRLWSLAFELRKSITVRAPSNLIEHARSLKAVSKFYSEYEDFIGEYSVKFPKTPPIIEGDPLMLLTSKLRTLDPRVSEYVLQFPSINRAARGSPIITLQNRVLNRVFLPFLLDSPIRTSAWEICANVRLLAYGLINLIVPLEDQVISVWEYRRQQCKFGGRKLRLPDLKDIPETCARYCKIYTELKKNLSGLENHHFWIAFAVYQEIEWSRSQDKVPLSNLVTNLIGTIHSYSDFDKLHQWEVIHLISQIEASLYSFRMLHQIIEVLMAHGCLGSFPPALIDLYQLMRTMPAINDYYNRNSAVRFFSIHLVSILTAVNDILCTARKPLSHQSVGDRAGKNVRNEQIPQKKIRKGLTNNLFDILDLE